MTIQDLEELGFEDVKQVYSRVVGKLFKNRTTLEDGEYCSSIIHISIRQVDDFSPWRGDILTIREFMLHDPTKEYSLEEIEDARVHKLYCGVVDNRLHLEKIINDTIYISRHEG